MREGVVMAEKHRAPAAAAQSDGGSRRFDKGAWRRGGRLGVLARNAAAGAIDLLYPPQCLLCADPIAEAGALCAACWRETPFISGAVCDHCGAPFGAASLSGENASDPEFERAYADESEGGLGSALCERCAPENRRDRPLRWDRGRAAALYAGPARSLALALKHADRTDAAPAMARWMARAGAPLAETSDVVVPVPLHWLRRLRRRYNQSALLATAVAERFDLPLELGALRRRRATKRQVGMSASARRKNVADAFEIAGRGAARIAGRRVLLIDNVLTTGATVGACADALRRAGARATHVLVFARVDSETEDLISVA